MKINTNNLLAATVGGVLLGTSLLGTGTAAMAASGDQGTSIELIKNDPGYTHMSLTFPTQVSMDEVEIDGEGFVKLGDIKGEAVSEHRAGAPGMPAAVRRLRIPNKSMMHVEIADAQYYELQGVNLAPSKGPISRELDPKKVPYTFGDEYQKDEFWPRDIAQLGDPWVMRDQRGADLKVTPFQYNPVTKTLRVYTSIELVAYADGEDDTNALAENARSSNRLGWQEQYAETFLNWAPYDIPVLVPISPEMIVITPKKWSDLVQPLVDHHNANGLWTVSAETEVVGDSTDEIRDFIAERYDTWDISYVLLVGDFEHIPTDLVDYVDSTGGTDPTYGFIDGNDHQPEVLIGRFSAETDEDVTTQVQRTIAYENQIGVFNQWRRRALGIGSDDGSGGDDGELDWEHLDEIRDDLLASGYTNVAQVYEPNDDEADVKVAIENGLGVINYTGHGSEESWVTTGFNREDVDDLENTGQLPWIISVACVNGQFHNDEDCFAERWLRATDSLGNPTGAVATFMSTVNQHWRPPMEAQDVIGDRTADRSIKRLANLCAAGTASMVSAYGQSGREMIETWTIFGDPALNLTPRPLFIIPILWPEWNFDLNLPESLQPRLMELTNNSQEPRFVEMDWSEDWIHVEPAVLMIEPGKTAQVKVYADLTRSQLAPGAYTASIVARDLNEDTADQGKLVRLEVTDADCEGDLDGDGRVSITDLLQILSQWGACGDCTADFNGDGTVDVTDLLTVLAAWGSC